MRLVTPEKKETKDLKSLILSKKNIIITSLAGCGKTHMLATLGQLSKELGRNYLAITYMRDAADGIKAKLNIEDSEDRISTIHSFFLSLIKQEPSLSNEYNAINKVLYEKKSESQKTEDPVSEILRNDNIIADILNNDEYAQEERSETNQIVIKDKQQAYAKMINLSKTHFHKLKDYIDFDLLLIDEYQDLTDANLPVIELLIKHLVETGGQVIIVGDPYQAIMEKNHALDKAEKLFPKDSYVKVGLNKSYRFKNNEIPNFVNGYYEKQKFTRRYSLTDKVNPNSDNVSIILLQNKEFACETVNYFAKDSIKEGKSVAIISRTNNELYFYYSFINKKEFKFNDYDKDEFGKNNLHTIHKFKGNQADVVIFLNMANGGNPHLCRNSEMEQNIFNVAITRAREKFIMVSTFPKDSVLANFKEGTYCLIDKQRDEFHKDYTTSLKLNVKNPFTDEKYEKKKEYRENIFKAYRLPKFDLRKEGEPINPYLLYDNSIERFKSLLNRLRPFEPLRLENFMKSMIDSIEIIVPYDKQPFTPYEKSNSKPRSQYETITEIQLGNNLKYTLFRRSGNLIFDFSNLAEFKRAGFTENEIIEAIVEIICKYFNYQLDPITIGSLQVKRLDLCKIFIFQNPIETLRYFRYFLYFGKGSFKKFRYPFHLKYQADKVKKTRKAGREVSVYRPKYKKKNKNPITDASENHFKIEIRRFWDKEHYKLADYGDTEFSCNIHDLIGLNTPIANLIVYKDGVPCVLNTFDELYKYMFEKELSFMEKDSFLINGYMSNVTRERNGIFNYEDIIKLCETGRIKTRDKRKYFIWFMRLIPEDFRNFLLNEIINHNELFTIKDEARVFEFIRKAKEKYLGRYPGATLSAA